MSDARPAPGDTVEMIVESAAAGQRLDRYLALRFTEYSRVYLRKLINAAAVRVNGKRTKASHNLRAGERVELEYAELPRCGPEPEDIALDILHEDAWLVVINKPAGMVVHPGKGNYGGTLTSALQHHFDQLSSVAGPKRPGIVHRLDRDTSGAIVVAKDDRTHLALSEQFQVRTVEKEYFAIVAGEPERDRDRIDMPIGPHPTHREKKAIRRDHSDAREADTRYEVVERFEGFACLAVRPRTGRTHQIRVHLDAVGYAVLCDRLYGGRRRLTAGELRRDEDETLILDRQALHARRLTFDHPHSGDRLTFEAPLPVDLATTLEAIRRWRPAR